MIQSPLQQRSVHPFVQLAAVCAFALWLAPSTTRGDDWPRWRGAGQNGVASGEGYAVKWAEEENVAWKVEVPGWGTSTPAISGDHIFLTCEDDEKTAILCLNRKGEKQWLTHFGKTAGNRNRKAGGANPSPVTDGEHVYAYYRNGDLACVDFEGKAVWQINIQEKYGRDALQWDLGTSPVLTKKLVVIAVMHQGPSYLVALDKKSGKEAWKVDRSVPAPREARDSYTTPLVISRGEQEVIVTAGADHVTAHAADTGKELWRAGGLNPNQRGNFRSIASPVVVGDVVIVPYSRGATLTAVRLGGTGDVTDTHVVWTKDIETCDVPTPIAHDGKVYLCGDRGQIVCIDSESGKTLWSEDPPRSRYVCSASPVLANGHLYATRENGATLVYSLNGDAPQLVSTNSVREYTYATPVFVDGQIYVRTSNYLIRIGKP